MSGRRESLEGMLSEIREILRCFREAQMSGTVIKYILTEEEDELVDYSARQVGRIHQQVMFMSLLYGKLQQRYEMELGILNEAFSNRSDASVTVLKQQRSDTYTTPCLPVLANTVSMQSEGVVKATAVLEWHRVFRACDCCGFPPRRPWKIRAIFLLGHGEPEDEI
jgi:hypothetical protein